MKPSIRILMVEDERSLSRVISAELTRMGFYVRAVATGEEALIQLQEPYDVLLLDMNLPGMGGIEVMRSLEKDEGAPEVIVLTGDTDVNNAVQAMKLGAYDYLPKPASLERLELIIRKAAEKRHLRKENLRFRSQLDSMFCQGGSDVIVLAEEMKRTFELAVKVAQTDATVLIQGETGTGKDILAGIIHSRSHRSQKPFIALNCAAIQESALENDLFGHEKGAFTDARERKLGFLEIAAEGTLFLDEISEMQPSMQAKLLHVLEKGIFYRLGGTLPIRTEARILTATNRDLRALVSDGTFRQDLFFRINMFSLHLPPLRERQEEIIPLAEKFLAQSAINRFLGDSAKEALQAYNWPGNVRELKHVIQRAALISENEFISPRDLALSFRREGDGIVDVTDTSVQAGGFSLETLERGHIQKVLDSLNWNQQEASRHLGIDPKTLYRKIRRYRLKRPTGGSPKRP